MTQETVEIETEVDIPRKIWTRKDAELLVELGFPNAERLELIDGELIDKMGKKRPHAIWQHLIQTWLQAAFGVEHVQMESPIDVAKEDNLVSEPEPDLIVTFKPSREYLTNPGHADIQLLVEVSDTTLKLDLRQKASLYARASIVEYWVIDIPHRLVHVHRIPWQGAYSSIFKFGFAENITPLAKQNAVFQAEKL